MKLIQVSGTSRPTVCDAGPAIHCVITLNLIVENAIVKTDIVTKEIEVELRNRMKRLHHLWK